MDNELKKLERKVKSAKKWYKKAYDCVKIQEIKILRRNENWK